LLSLFAQSVRRSQLLCDENLLLATEVMIVGHGSSQVEEPEFSV